MTSYIDSNFNDGLNLLNYKCGIRCYVYKNGNECSNISGGWYANGGNKDTYFMVEAYSAGTLVGYTKSTVNITNYSSITFNYLHPSPGVPGSEDTVCKYGVGSNTSANSYNASGSTTLSLGDDDATYTKTVNISSVTGSKYVKLQGNSPTNEYGDQVIDYLIYWVRLD